MLKDDNGAFEITFVYEEPDNNQVYEMRKYVNSKKIKSLGGMFALYSQTTKRIKHYKSEYLRDKAYSKFVRDDREEQAESSTVDKDIKSVATNRVRFMKMPYIVCLEDLTDDEHKEFIRLFNKITEGKNISKK